MYIPVFYYHFQFESNNKPLHSKINSERNVFNTAQNWLKFVCKLLIFSLNQKNNIKTNFISLV